MFNSIEEFRKFNNTLVTRCVFIIYMVLTVAYVIEYMKGNRSIGYVVSFCCLLWISYTLDVLFIKSKKYSNYSSYVIVLGYLVFYTFCMLTTVVNLTWIYIFPFAVLVPMLFRNIAVVIASFIAFLLINVVEVLFHLDNYISTESEIVELEQRFACILLVLTFLFVLCQLLQKYESVVAYIYKEASIDAITGLKSNDYITEKVVPMVGINKNIIYSFVLINIDKFYRFNDNYSHAFGDNILSKVGDIVSETLSPISPSTCACRIYGDKFVILFSNRSYDEVDTYYKTIKSRLNSLIMHKGTSELFISTTVSVTDTRFCEHSYDGLYKRAKYLQDIARSKGDNNLIEDDIGK